MFVLDILYWNKINKNKYDHGNKFFCVTIYVNVEMLMINLIKNRDTNLALCYSLWVRLFQNKV